MKVMIFDTETTGLPVDFKAPPTDLDNWPRIIQIAYMVFDSSKTIKKPFLRVSTLVKPEGFEIPPDAQEIHGITTEIAEREGEPLEDVLNQFLTDYEGVNVLVAHNIDFDYPVLAAEMIRKGLRSKNRARRICTKKETINFCAIPSPKFKGYKWPKLQELHEVLFGETFEGDHDAMVDTRACARCFWELVKKGVIKLEIQQKLNLR